MYTCNSLARSLRGIVNRRLLIINTMMKLLAPTSICHTVSFILHSAPTACIRLVQNTNTHQYLCEGFWTFWRSRATGTRISFAFSPTLECRSKELQEKDTTSTAKSHMLCTSATRTDTTALFLGHKWALKVFSRFVSLSEYKGCPQLEWFICIESYS